MRVSVKGLLSHTMAMMLALLVSIADVPQGAFEMAT
jgi:hypothetical protein